MPSLGRSRELDFGVEIYCLGCLGTTTSSLRAVHVIECDIELTNYSLFIPLANFEYFIEKLNGYKVRQMKLKFD